VFDAEKSGAGQATCTLEPLVSKYSVDNYALAKPAVLKGTWEGSADQAQLDKLNDGINTIDYEVSGNSCSFQFQDAREGYMYAISEVRFFINGLDRNMPHVNNLDFEVTTDGSNWSNVWSVDSGIHKGWNSMNIDEVAKSFRFVGSQSGACKVGEIQVTGIEVYNSGDANEVSCTPKLTIGAESQNLSSNIKYSSESTPVLTSMSKRFATVLGGDEIVFTGTDFQEPSELRFLSTGGITATVKIDGRTCTVTDQNETTITCTTDTKPDSEEDPSLVITVDGMGNAATQGKVFRYVKRWSDTETWGGNLPTEGQAVSVPKGMHLLVDVPSTPILSFINVEGSLIFDQDNAGTFDAEYIIAKGGYVEIGTEEDPYMGDLTITMYGREYGTTLPLFGNKVLAVKSPGQLEMHGKPRDIAWTDLKMTADKKATSIKINDIQSGKTFDWAVGEEIVIASTDFEGRHAEQRTITEVDTTVNGTPLNPVLKFDTPLEYKHYADVQTFGSETIEMRAEVGLLSRNVVFRGNPKDSTPNKYGAHIMLADGESGVSGRIENIELTDVGQAFKLGRYPIHFHLAGNVNGSYIKNNAIHNSFNRGITIHGVQHLHLENNVIYKEMGHGVFIEDGVETGNLIKNNLVVDTRASHSLLVTD
jgi:hypothetical protein